jgi:hypothetical protein
MLSFVDVFHMTLWFCSSRCVLGICGGERS